MVCLRYIQILSCFFHSNRFQIMTKCHLVFLVSVFSNILIEGVILESCSSLSDEITDPTVNNLEHFL